MSKAKGGAFALVLDQSPTVWTSLEEFHFRLAKAQIARGIPTVFVYAAMPRKDCLERLASSGAAITAANFRQGRLRYCRALRAIFRKYGVTTVQTRGFNYFHWIWWALRALGVRRVVFVEGNGGEIGARSWKKLLLRARARFFTAPVARVVAISSFIERRLSDLGVNNVQMIHNGIDLDRFHPDDAVKREWREEYQVQPGEAIICTIAYLRSIKQPHVLFEACGYLAQRGVPFRFFVAGTGELVEPLKLLSQKLQIADRVHWLGNYLETERLLQASDIFILSTIGEALGNAFLEAQATGVPSVATDSGGIPEIIVPGETGYLIPPGDSRSMADAVQRLIEDRALWKRMSDASIARARSRFAVDRAVEDYLRVLDCLP